MLALVNLAVWKNISLHEYTLSLVFWGLWSLTLNKAKHFSQKRNNYLHLFNTIIKGSINLLPAILALNITSPKHWCFLSPVGSFHKWSNIKPARLVQSSVKLSIFMYFFIQLRTSHCDIYLKNLVWLLSCVQPVLIFYIFSLFIFARSDQIFSYWFTFLAY